MAFSSFKSSTLPFTGSDYPFTDGVTNNGVPVGTLTFAVPSDAPTPRYYICGHHSQMQGIVDQVTVAPARGPEPTTRALYLVHERFKNGDAAPVYRRFRERGRLAPVGLAYVSSWVDLELTRCWQVMETDDRALLDRWIQQWSDLVDFEVHPVMTSKEAAERIAPKL